LQISVDFAIIAVDGRDRPTHRDFNELPALKLALEFQRAPIVAQLSFHLPKFNVGTNTHTP
jgi:hypothetical protein